MNALASHGLLELFPFRRQLIGQLRAALDLDLDAAGIHFQMEHEVGFTIWLDSYYQRGRPQVLQFQGMLIYQPLQVFHRMHGLARARNDLFYYWYYRLRTRGALSHIQDDRCFGSIVTRLNRSMVR